MKKAALISLTALSALAAASSAHAAPLFLQDASESTVTNVLRPWTQNEACSCCVCWETALTTILSYWDDHRYGPQGPWESLLLGGNGFDDAPFAATSEQLYTIAGIECKSGSTWINFFSHTSVDTCESFTNVTLGYSFDYDVDEWVWFGRDVHDEIAADKPVYYAYEPEGTGAHAVTIVGVDDADETLFLYKNWYPVVTHKGFDEANNHYTANITPGGRAPVPSSWTCSPIEYEGGDGCHCECGAYDPDCDNPALVVRNCAPNEMCNRAGQCEGGCVDDCAYGTAECADAGQIRLCGNFDSDPCAEWGPPRACGAGASCTNNQCIATCEPECQAGSAQCVDESHVQHCIAFAVGECPTWGEAEPCPGGETCVDGRCIGAGGAGGAPGAGGSPGTGGSTPGGNVGAPAPSDKSNDDSGCGCRAGAAGLAEHWLLLATIRSWIR